MQALSIQEVVIARGFKWHNLAEIEAANQPIQSKEQEKEQRQEVMKLILACCDCV